jgi:hypothetical protein
MRSHLLGMLEPASIFQVNRHTGRAPGVTPDRRQKLALEKKITDSREFIKQNQKLEIPRLLNQQRQQEEHPGIDR